MEAEEDAHMWLRNALELSTKLGRRVQRLRERGEAKIVGQRMSKPTKEEKRHMAAVWYRRTTWLERTLEATRKSDHFKGRGLRGGDMELAVAGTRRGMVRQMDKADERGVVNFLEMSDDEFYQGPENVVPSWAGEWWIQKRMMAVMNTNAMVAITGDAYAERDVVSKIRAVARAEREGTGEVQNGEDLDWNLLEWNPRVRGKLVWEVLDSEDSTDTEWEPEDDRPDVAKDSPHWPYQVRVCFRSNYHDTVSPLGAQGVGSRTYEDLYKFHPAAQPQTSRRGNEGEFDASEEAQGGEGPREARGGRPKIAHGRKTGRPRSAVFLDSQGRSHLRGRGSRYQPPVRSKELVSTQDDTEMDGNEGDRDSVGISGDNEDREKVVGGEMEVDQDGDFEMQGVEVGSEW